MSNPDKVPEVPGEVFISILKAIRDELAKIYTESVIYVNEPVGDACFPVYCAEEDVELNACFHDVVRVAQQGRWDVTYAGFALGKFFVINVLGDSGAILLDPHDTEGWEKGEKITELQHGDLKVTLYKAKTKDGTKPGLWALIQSSDWTEERVYWL